jgi:hypothetical protein
MTTNGRVCFMLAMVPAIRNTPERILLIKRQTYLQAAKSSGCVRLWLLETSMLSKQHPHNMRNC